MRIRTDLFPFPGPRSGREGGVADVPSPGLKLEPRSGWIRTAPHLYGLGPDIRFRAQQSILEQSITILNPRLRRAENAVIGERPRRIGTRSAVGSASVNLRGQRTKCSGQIRTAH